MSGPQTVDEMCAVIDLGMARIAQLTKRVDELCDERDEYKSVLEDLLMCRSEQLAIGGGPGWQERERKAWRAAEELFEP